MEYQENVGKIFFSFKIVIANNYCDYGFKYSIINFAETTAFLKQANLKPVTHRCS